MRVERVASKRQCCNVDGEIVDGEIVDVDGAFSSLCFIPSARANEIVERACVSLP